MAVPEPSPLQPSSILTVFANTATIIGTTIGYIIFNLNFPRKGIVGASIVIKPYTFARKIRIPVKIVSITLYLDFNLILSSTNPITPDTTTVKMKIKISLKKFGKKIINNNEVHAIPISKAIPPDSATSGLELLWISIPIYPFFFINFMTQGMINIVIAKPTIKMSIK